MILMGILIDLGRSGDLPHLLLSTLEVFGGRAAVESFFDAAARVLRSVQRIYNFADELRLYSLDSPGDLDSEPYVSEVSRRLVSGGFRGGVPRGAGVWRRWAGPGWYLLPCCRCCWMS